MNSPDSPRPALPAGASSVAQALRAAAEQLTVAGVPDPDVDAALLLGHLLGLSRGGVQAAEIRGDTVDPARVRAFGELVARRVTREPLQHIIGTAPFRHLELRVGPGVFVPRPETELAAQIAVDFLQSTATPEPVAVDLGTGSGAIALALSTEVPHARVYAAENSADAFPWTTANFETFGGDNAQLAFIDLNDAFPELDGTVDVVVSNPPYVPDDAIPRDPEVRLYDPPAALYGGVDGLDIVREVSRTAWRLARSGGLLVIEHGEWQGQAIRELLAADGWRGTATHPDLTMRDRATTAIRP